MEQLLEDIRIYERQKKWKNSPSKVVTLQNLYIPEKPAKLMKKWIYTAKTLEDKMIVDALCGISQLDSFPESKERYFMVGGFAVQSYVPAQYRRGTCDIDLNAMMPLNREGFLRFAKPTIEYLADKGYNIETDKGQNAFEIRFNKEGDGGVIEFHRRSPENYAGVERRLEREMQNTRMKVVHGRTEQYRVKSPEDIVIPKIVRGIGSLKRHWERLYNYLHYFDGPLTDKKVKETIERIDELKEEAMIHVMDLDRVGLVESVRFLADLYDTKVLSETVGFNENYLLAAKRDYDTLMKRTRERDEVLNVSLPSLLINEEPIDDSPSLFPEQPSQ